MILELWSKLALARRRQFVLLAVLMVVASAAEVVSVGAILPLLTALTSPELLFKNTVIRPILQYFHIETAQQVLLPVTVFFCLAALAGGSIRLLLLWANTRYSYAVGADLSIDVYRRTLYQAYAVHVGRNSSEVINAILGKTAMTTGSVLVPMLTLISSGILLGGVLLALLAVDPVIAISASVCIAVIYWLILRGTKKHLLRNSKIIAKESGAVIKALQEGLGGIRDVLLDGNQEVYCNIFQRSDRPLRLAQGGNTFISASPRYAIETFGMIVLAGLAYAIYQRDGSVAAAVPVLGTLALGAQRVLPIFQNAYSSLSILRGAESSLRDMLVMLDQPLPDHCPSRESIPNFEHELAIENLGFRYSEETPLVLQNINIRIPAGARVGIMGTTGSGKSTLLDLLMGLLLPSEGKITVDGIVLNEHNRRSWQTLLAHVPQSIYLADSSILENIAFGVPCEQIDMARVEYCAAQAQLDQVISGLPENYATLVGERGVRLSGGQRQRIGIARALYKQANVIVLDEATSALDTGTEVSVMNSIDGLGPDLTILIVAHRLTTLKNCDMIVELVNGQVKRIGRYEEIVTNV